MEGRAGGAGEQRRGPRRPGCGLPSLGTVSLSRPACPGGRVQNPGLDWGPRGTVHCRPLLTPASVTDSHVRRVTRLPERPGRVTDKKGSHADQSGIGSKNPIPCWGDRARGSCPPRAVDLPTDPGTAPGSHARCRSSSLCRRRAPRGTGRRGCPLSSQCEEGRDQRPSEVSSAG